MLFIIINLIEQFNYTARLSSTFLNWYLNHSYLPRRFRKFSNKGYAILAFIRGEDYYYIRALWGLKIIVKGWLADEQ